MIDSVLTNFICEGEVRDNEIDFQGIVNNANYFVYMAFARHKQLQALGIDISQMHDEGFDLVLVHSEIDFRDSLHPWDQYQIISQMKLVGKIRVLFHQQIVRKIDQKLIVTGDNVGVCVNRKTGRPFLPVSLKVILAATS